MSIFQRLDLGEVEAEGFERGLELSGGAVGDLGPGLLPADVEVADVRVLLAPAVDFDFDLLGELAAQVFDVDAGAAVDVGRIFLGEERCAHSDFSPARRSCAGTLLKAGSG